MSVKKTISLGIVQLIGLSAFATKPNIIYILADDLGYGDLSCYGQKHFQTPNIDRMASEGMRFTQHYAGTTVCAPSRSSLIPDSLPAIRRFVGTSHMEMKGSGPFLPTPSPSRKC